MLRKVRTTVSKAVPRTGMNRQCPAFVLVAMVVSVAPAIRAADSVEIKIELNSTWKSQTKTNQHTKTARCVVGTNGWYIAGDFIENAATAYWLIGTNVIEHRIITSSMYLRQAEDFVSEHIPRRKPVLPMAGSYPHGGEKFTTVHPSPQGQPAGQGMANAVWLAFCSGTYLNL